MRGMFANVPMYGHVAPTLPVVKELCKLGHKITYWLTPSFEELVTEHGASFRAYTTDISDFMPLISQGHVTYEILREARRILPVIYQATKVEKPDYIVADSTCVWAPLLARALNVRLITTHPACLTDPEGCFVAPLGELYALPRENRYYYHALFKLYTQLYKIFNIGAFEASHAQMYPGDLVIVFVPSWFDDEAEGAGDRFVHVGPSIPTTRNDVVAKDLKKLDKGRKLVFMSRGTIYDNQPHAYLSCIQAFAEQKAWHLLLSAGQAYDVLSNHSLPTNVTIYRSVDQLSVLQHSDLFVSHGGMNSIMEAFSTGVPLILSPVMVEQCRNTQRVCELELGATVNLETCSPAALLKLADEVTSDFHMRDRLQNVKANLARSEGASRSAARIDKLLRHQEP